MKMIYDQQPFIKMEKEELKQLCSEVKETLATEAHTKNISNQQFGVADLWKIQKTQRYRVQRRNSMF